MSHPEPLAQTIKMPPSDPTWEIPAEQLARALSAKPHEIASPNDRRYKQDTYSTPGGSSSSDQKDLENSVHGDAVLDEDNLASAIPKIAGSTKGPMSRGHLQKGPYYSTLARYLNRVLKACRPHVRGRYLQNFQFQAYDADTAGGFQLGSHIYLAGTHSSDRSSPTSPGLLDPPRFYIPVAAQATYTDTMEQAGSYACVIFQNDPLREFVLVLGYRHDRKELRFLVFDHDGLTMSPALKSTNKTGREGIARLFYALCTWEIPTDAGLLWSSIDADPMPLRIGRIGVAKRYHPPSVSSAAGTTVDNHHSLPPEAASSFLASSSRAPQKEERGIWRYATHLTPLPLTSANNHKEWARAIASAVLDYYILVLNGFIHLDINIDNVFLLQEPVNLSEPVIETLRKLDIPDTKLNSLNDVIGKLGLSNNRFAIMAQGNLVANFKNPKFYAKNRALRIGREEFVSDRLIRNREGYGWYPQIESPLDDFYSWYYTAQWSAVFRVESQGTEFLLHWFQRGLRLGKNSRSEATHSVEATCWDELGWGAFLAGCQPFLRAWYKSIIRLNDHWERYLHDNKSDSEKLPQMFKDIAFEGAMATFQCVLDFVNGLERKDQ